MNISVLGTIPWREFTSTTAPSTGSTTPIALFMQRAYPGPHGQLAAVIAVVLVALAAGSSVLALLLGYSRIPYAAAMDGNFPKFFAKLNAGHKTPNASLGVLSAVTLFCCLFRLQEVISTLVVIRILFQFLLQGVAVLLPRHRRARRTSAFRMPLYPLPVLLALSGFLFILLSRPNYLREMRTAACILLVGILVYGMRLVDTRPASQETQS